jgi:hypothetical protein
MNRHRHTELWAVLLAVIAFCDVLAVKTFEGTWTALVFGGLFFAALFPLLAGMSNE